MVAASSPSPSTAVASSSSSPSSATPDASASSALTAPAQAPAAADQPAFAEKEKLIVFDTTLRDGEQSPGVTLTVGEKVEIARQLSRLGVDVCEAGFPVASPGDFEAVARIAKEVGPLTEHRKTGKPMIIAALARAVETDVRRAYDAVRHAPLHRIHTFLATSDLHLTHKLRISRDQCVDRAERAVKLAKSLGCQDVEFSPEDAGRSDRAFLCRVLEAVIDAGATTLNIPDTVGYNTPDEFGALIRHLIRNTRGAEKVVWSTHCHNDLGLATANTLAGIANGARQVEVAVNGIGERAGNTALEEVVMAVHTHAATSPVYHTIDTVQLFATSQLVTKRTGMPIQPNKAIVGANAFAHESGIHQDGVLKHKATYEIIQPETVGTPSNSLPLGKHSGRNALRARVERLLGPDAFAKHFAPPNPAASDPAANPAIQQPNPFDNLFAAFKRLADSKKSAVDDANLAALVDATLGVAVADPAAAVPPRFRLRAVRVHNNSDARATASVVLVDAEAEDHAAAEVEDAATGASAVHAVVRAVDRVAGIDARAVRVMYHVFPAPVADAGNVAAAVWIRDDNSSSGAAEKQEARRAAPTPPLLVAEPPETSSEAVATGRGQDADVVVAVARAYVDAVNRYLARRVGKVAGATA